MFIKYITLSLIIASFLFFSPNAAGQSPDSNLVYHLSFRNLDNEIISLGQYTGKKILITAFDGSAPDTSFLLELNNIQNNSDSLIVIAFAASDFGEEVDTALLFSIKNNLSLNYPISLPAFVKKDKEQQDALYHWLTHHQENGHFDLDIENPNQIYLTNSEGKLNILIGSGIPYNELVSIVHNQK